MLTYNIIYRIIHYVCAEVSIRRDVRNILMFGVVFL